MNKKPKKPTVFIFCFFFGSCFSLFLTFAIFFSILIFYNMQNAVDFKLKNKLTTKLMQLILLILFSSNTNFLFHLCVCFRAVVIVMFVNDTLFLYITLGDTFNYSCVSSFFFNTTAYYFFFFICF